MFNLPLSKTLDCEVTKEGMTLTPHDGKRLPIKLTPEEALALLSILVPNEKMIERELKRSTQQ